MMPLKLSVYCLNLLSAASLQQLSEQLSRTCGLTNSYKHFEEILGGNYQPGITNQMLLPR